MTSLTSVPDQTRTADRLLMLLKTRGALTTRALAEALDISVPAVRQHLNSLEALVESATVNHGIGRPARTWRLSKAGQGQFPDTHAELTVRLIGFIEDGLGPEALQAVLDRAYQRNLEHYSGRLASAHTMGNRVKRLAAIRSEEGYMAEAYRSGSGWVLVEHHCPICAAAETCQGFCRNELELFRTVLGDGVRVERTEYLLDGGERCAYFIAPQGSGGTR
jgi:iron-sulfur cluster biosynthesis transcriptional regulator SufR